MSKIKEGSIIIFEETDESRYFKNKKVVVRIGKADCGGDYWVENLKNKDLSKAWKNHDKLCLGIETTEEGIKRLATKEEQKKVIN